MVCIETDIPDAERVNLSTWLNYQLSRWLVRTGRRGHWYIEATMGRRARKRR